MTAPVMQIGGNDIWVIRLIMPQGSTVKTLPKPNNPALKLRDLAPTRVAVIKFIGLARQDDVKPKTAALLQFVKSQRLNAIRAPSLAQYDAPWILWFMRRVEVMIPVARCFNCARFVMIIGYLPRCCFEPGVLIQCVSSAR